ncbi:MAG: antibiotic biosynthesis monooxygenase [Alphaproteobacteria bacterium TMED194]|nr:MAG: antibiotic biosynthesis monooxygenase [Alphaproteobacteria bacterium TMED194]RPH09607.1 MAG: antibiotic biosynthesis monooxygenase [Alphaproteobacteria bacterium TMED194]
MIMRDSENPFVLLARITVKDGMVDAYLEIAEEVDRAVENTEEGMLLHTFDRDPDDPHKFVWTEVYRKSDDFLFHADNPPVLEYVEKHAELATHFSIEIYGNVSNEVIEAINSREIPLKHFASTSVGYIRSERFA